MIDVNLNDFYSGGYFLVRSGKPEWDQLQDAILPERLLSFSNHMAPKLDVTWGWIPGNPDAAIEFGIPQEKLDEFLDWCKSDFQSSLDFPSMFYSVTDARAFIQHFEPNTENLRILGAGLPKELVAQYWQDKPTSEINDIGIEKRIRQHLPIEEGGISIGFDVVGFSHQNFDCSWLCSYLHRDMYALYNIHPNRYGLIDTYTEAKQTLDWIYENPKHAEPVGYDVWLMVDYPLEAGA